MNKYKEYRIKAPQIQSLCWHDNKLYDWVAGGAVYHLDGTKQDGFCSFSYRFDSAQMSPSGEFAVIYERLGTKTLLLHQGQILRELNRSFYHAAVYDYPIAFAQLPSGQEVLIHCPQDYCQLEIEDALTGQCLTTQVERKPADIFHSCLSVSPDGQWLLSAGWLWHPFECVCLYNIHKALKNPATLDQVACSPCTVDEADTACFTQQNQLIIATNGENNNDEELEDASLCAGRGVIACFMPEQGRYKSQALAEQIVGRCFGIAEDYLLGFYEYPKLFQISTGKVIQRWENLKTSNHQGSIIWHLDKFPIFAVDELNQRFAVADQEGITIIEMQL